MPELKPIAKESVSRALSKAERYRFLNEPREAESICRDVLAVDPPNQAAITCLILALTDLFHGLEVRPDEARALIKELTNPFDRAYYGGMIEERWAKALLAAGYPHDSIRLHIDNALARFEEADRLASNDNDDAVLRWNACVRLLDRAGIAEVAEEVEGVSSFDDDMPMR